MGSTVEIVDGLHVSRAVIDVVPAAGSEQTALQVNVGIALDGTGLDASLDKTLHLRKVSANGIDFDVHGINSEITLEGTHKHRVVLEAANSGRMSVLWDVDAAVGVGEQN